MLVMLSFGFSSQVVNADISLDVNRVIQPIAESFGARQSFVPRFQRSKWGKPPELHARREPAHPRPA